MNNILLFYKYVSIPDPQLVLQWQKTVCHELALKGRIILAHEGINGTLGGSDQALQQYITAMGEHPLFGGIDFKQAPGGADCFPRLRVVVKKEIVHLGVDSQLVSAKDGGVHLTPVQAHEVMQRRPADLLVFDARNNFESRIGTFVDAVTPDIGHFRELPAYIKANLEQFKDKEVLMFCTGGIRCERASAYLKQQGVAKQVYQIEGGIHRYIEQFPDGYFRGKNYVFDGRVAVKVNDDVVGRCALCNVACDEYNNCLNASCNKHFIGCQACITEYQATCSTNCRDLLACGAVHKRPLFKKVSSEL
jgi:predicted sulfurtransferase